MFLFLLVPLCVHACSVYYSEVDILTIISHNYTNVTFVGINATDRANETCTFLVNDTIEIVIDDMHALIRDLSTLSVGEFKGIVEWDILVELEEFARTSDIRHMKEVCVLAIKLSKYLQMVPFLDQLCILFYSMQGPVNVKPVVYRGKNLHFSGEYIKTIQRIYKRRNESAFHPLHNVSQTNMAIELGNSIWNGIDYVRNYGLWAVDAVHTAFGVRPREFNLLTVDIYYAALSIAKNPLAFARHLTSQATNIWGMWEDHLEAAPIQGSYSQYWDLLRQKGGDLLHVLQERKSLFPSFSLPAAYTAPDYSKHSLYNGTCTFLNTSLFNQTGTETPKPFLKLFTLISLSNIPNMWFISRSTFRPTEKGGTSVFRVWVPADYGAWIVYRVERWYRSPYIGHLFGASQLEQDVYNCMPGWPLFVDPQFNCSVTEYAPFPGYFSEEEERDMDTGSTGMCDPWKTAGMAMQGWLRYTMALFSPITTFIACRSTAIGSAFGFMYFTVDGKIPCIYTDADIPKFAEACLLVRGVFLALLIAAIGFTLCICGGACARICQRHSTTGTTEARVEGLEGEHAPMRIRRVEIVEE